MKSPVTLLFDAITSQFATIKPPSTPAVAADPALVVALSPGSPNTVIPADSLTPTYTAAVSNLSAAGAATDIFTITGSASKIIRIRELRMMGRRTSAGDFAFEIIKRSTANAGGTFATVAGVVHDSTDPDATAVVRAYSANPSTLGTSIGVVRTGRVYFSGSGSASVPNEVGYTFGGMDRALTLRGTSQVLAMNFIGQTIAGTAVQVYVKWTEE